MVNINFFGTAIMVLMLIPNAFYALKHRGAENKCTSRFANLAEQIGRYGSMMFMIVNVNGLYGFKSNEIFAVWLVSMAVLMAGYYVFWVLYAHKAGRFFALMLAIIPSCIFIYSGAVSYLPLLITGLIFAPAHIYITYKNNI